MSDRQVFYVYHFQGKAGKKSDSENNISCEKNDSDYCETALEKFMCCLRLFLPSFFQLRGSTQNLFPNIKHYLYHVLTVTHCNGKYEFIMQFYILLVKKKMNGEEQIMISWCKKWFRERMDDLSFSRICK